MHSSPLPANLLLLLIHFGKSPFHQESSFVKCKLQPHKVSKILKEYLTQVNPVTKYYAKAFELQFKDKINNIASFYHPGKLTGNS